MNTQNDIEKLGDWVMTQHESDEIQQRFDRLDTKITAQIEALRKDISSWVHGDNHNPGIHVRLDRLEHIQTESRSKHATILALVCSVLSGAMAWIATMFGMGGKP